MASPTQPTKSPAGNDAATSANLNLNGNESNNNNKNNNNRPTRRQNNTTKSSNIKKDSSSSSKGENLTGLSRAVHWFNSLPKHPNPGKFDNLYKEKDIVQPRGVDAFEGAKFEYERVVNRHFSLIHAFNLNRDSSNYAFTAGYQRGPLNISGTFVPVSGSVRGGIGYQYKLAPYRTLIVRASGRALKKVGASSAELEVDVKLRDSTITAILNYPRQVDVSYTQQLTSNFATGVSGSYDGVSGMSVISAAGRYTQSKGPYPFAVYAQLVPHQHILLAFAQSSQRKRKQMVAQIAYNKGAEPGSALASRGAPTGWDAVYTLGYHYNLVSSKLTASLDSKLRGNIFLEENLTGWSSIQFSAQADYSLNQFKFGFGTILRQ